MKHESRYISWAANKPLMPNKSTSLLKSFVAELQSSTGCVELATETEVAFVAQEKTHHLDALVRMRLPIGDEFVIAVELLGRAYPRDILHVMNQLQKWRERADEGQQVVLAVVAEYLSPGAKAELKEAGISYYDGGSSMFFRHRTYLVSREFVGEQPPPRRSIRLFSGAREQVVHALLEHWRRTKGAEYIGGAELANKAETSTYTVSSTMQEMERENWIEATGSGPALRRRLRDPAGLLDAWAHDWASRKEHATRWYIYAKTNPVDAVLWNLREHVGDGWAVTGAAAANAVVPHLTSVDRVQIVVPPGETKIWAEELQLKPAEKGSNVMLIERTGAALMFLDEHPERPGSRFASRFIQYLDLLDGYGRNKELAEEYRRVALGLRDRI